MARDEVLTIKDLFELHLAGAGWPPSPLARRECREPGPDEAGILAAFRFDPSGLCWSYRLTLDGIGKSTAMLMTRFYQLWRNGKQAASAGPGRGPKRASRGKRFRHPSDGLRSI